MKKAFLFLIIASLAALGICAFSSDPSYDESLIRVSLKEALGRNAEAALSESSEVQALFLDYSASPELLLKLRIAILKYGDTGRSILTAYGSEPEFRSILENYGETIIPVIDYFVRNDLLSLRVQKKMEAAGEKAKELWDRVTGESASIPPPNTQPAPPVYGPTQRGWHAVLKIHEEGHDFLSQFVIDRNKKAEWIQTERLLEGVGWLFASGVRALETKCVLDQEIKAADLLWAGMDAAVFASAVKVLRAGKALAYSGKPLSVIERTRLIAGRMVPKGAFARKMLKYSSAAGVVYIVVKHPGLLNGILSEAAKTFGLNPLLVQFAGWTLLIFALLFPSVPLLSIFLTIGIRALSILKGGLQKPVNKKSSAEMIS